MSTDPFERLLAHLRQVSTSLDPTTSDDEVIANAIAAGAPTRHARPRRSRLRLSGIVAAGLLVVGSGAAAARSLARNNGRPEAGTVCRTAPNLQSSARVIPLSNDPIGDCAALWVSGVLPKLGQVNGVGAGPLLIACVGDITAIEVLPATDGETCSSLGLSDADSASAGARPAFDAVMELTARLSTEINMVCTPPAAASDAIREILVDLEMVDWAVVVEKRDGACGRAGLDGANRTVFVIPGPLEPRG